MASVQIGFFCRWLLAKISRKVCHIEISAFPQKTSQPPHWTQTAEPHSSATDNKCYKHTLLQHVTAKYPTSETQFTVCSDVKSWILALKWRVGSDKSKPVWVTLVSRRMKQAEMWGQSQGFLCSSNIRKH